jgi:threonine/homoserine/homoserine lactone efflux protein
MVALPIAYGWAFRPATRPPDAATLIPILELVGVVAATVALLLGRRARAFGDRTAPAIWAPRLGGAAFVGYAVTVAMIAFRG